MTREELLILITVYIAPSSLAVLLSIFAKSRLARAILLFAGLASLLVIGAIVVAEIDCERSEFTYYKCGLLPDAVGDAIGLLQIFYVVAYLTAGPASLVIAGLAEWWTRRELSRPMQPR